MIYKKLKIRKLDWDVINRKHIQKHEVNEKEVEYLMHDKSKLAFDAKTRDRLVVVGKSGSRILTVILKELPRSKGKFYVVTARDASEEERTLYRERLS